MSKINAALFEGLRSDILLLLVNNNQLNCMSKITRKIGCTYSYGVKVIGIFVDGGYVISKPIGRRREIALTPKGEMVAEAIIEYRAALAKAEALYT